MSKIPILLVEDNLLVGNIVKEQLEEEGYDLVFVSDGESAEIAMKENDFAACVCDLQLPDTTGIELLKKWHADYPKTLVIIMTAYGEIKTAIEAIKFGAYDYLTKPVEEVLLKQVVKNAVEQFKLGRELTVLTQLHKRSDSDNEGLTFQGLIVSESMKETVDMVKIIAHSDFSCLFIQGETGTGKGLFAKTIHKIGKRSKKPFVEINCSALPATLVESELFGHKKGAFTDAKEDKIGLFELADEGTLFLDEIGDMDVNLQAKLLKVIEDQSFRRIGDIKNKKINVTIIAATHQNIEKIADEGKFRRDLYYRLNVVPLTLPPLRDNMDSIPFLCEHFISMFAKKFNKNVTSFTEEALTILMSYDWPGNVRELRNIVERGCILTQDSQIDVKHFLSPMISMKKNNE